MLSKAARTYKQQVARAVREQLGRMDAIAGPVAVYIELSPPNARKRDIDNHAGKAVLDGLEHAGVLHDDAQVRELHAVMRTHEKTGYCRVEVMAL
jgi:Holliday junction resolvase RusA-like endonuclease